MNNCSNLLPTFSEYNTFCDQIDHVRSCLNYNKHVVPIEMVLSDTEVYLKLLRKINVRFKMYQDSPYMKLVLREDSLAVNSAILNFTIVVDIGETYGESLKFSDLPPSLLNAFLDNFNQGIETLECFFDRNYSKSHPLYPLNYMYPEMQPLQGIHNDSILEFFITNKLYPQMLIALHQHKAFQYLEENPEGKLPVELVDSLEHFLERVLSIHLCYDELTGESSTANGRVKVFNEMVAYIKVCYWNIKFRDVPKKNLDVTTECVVNYTGRKIKENIIRLFKWHSIEEVVWAYLTKECPPDPKS